MHLRVFAAAAFGAAALAMSGPVLAAPATMTFQVTVTGTEGSAVMPGATTFLETFTLQDGVFSGFGTSTELMGDLAGSDGLTAGLKGLVDLTGASDYSNWSLGTSTSPFPPSITNTEGDLYENIFSLNGSYQQSLTGAPLQHYLPPSQSAAGLADFFQHIEPLDWYERVSDSEFRTIAGYTGTATLVSFTGGAAPEPAAWALMLVGFGAAGAALRRRRVIASA